MPIISQTQCVAISPINALVKPTEYNVCYNNVLNFIAVNILGIDCLKELQDAITLSETEPIQPLEERWANLLLEGSQGGGGFLHTLAWHIYLEWLKIYGRGSVVTKGFENRTSEFSEHTEQDNYHRIIANAQSTAKQFLAITERFLKDNEIDYPCLPKPENTCIEKKIQDFPNFTVL